MLRLQDDNQEFRVDLNKSIKLHEVVIENKFKDIRMQNDLDRKAMSEIVTMSVKNLKSNGEVTLGEPNKVGLEQVIKDMAFMKQELIMHAEQVSERNAERIMS